MKPRNHVVLAMIRQGRNHQVHEQTNEYSRQQVKNLIEEELELMTDSYNDDNHDEEWCE